MARAKDKEFASTEARAAVSSLYRKLRDDAVRFALSTFGNADPDLEELEEKELPPKKD